MSFREVRTLKDICETVGYPRLVSMEGFRRPNFELVADMLEFFCKRFDSEAFTSMDISTEEERIAFLKHCLKIAHQHLPPDIRLSAKKLYVADGNA